MYRAHIKSISLIASSDSYGSPVANPTLRDGFTFRRIVTGLKNLAGAREVFLTSVRDASR